MRRLSKIVQNPKRAQQPHGGSSSKRRRSPRHPRHRDSHDRRHNGRRRVGRRRPYVDDLRTATAAGAAHERNTGGARGGGSDFGADRRIKRRQHKRRTYANH